MKLFEICCDQLQLIAEKKIKKQKELPPITEEEKPFDLPQGWEWCRLGELSNIYRGSSPRPKGSPLYWTENRTEYYWITISDISNYCVNGLLLDTKEFLTENGSLLSTFVEKNELIIAVSGSTTGKSCLTAISGYIYDGLACVKTIKGIEKTFLYQFMQYVYQRLNNSKTGSAFPNINTDTLRLLQFPLPPFSEQERIVEKVDKLMALCDELEQEVTSAKKYASQLMEAVLQEAFSNKTAETKDNVIAFAPHPQQANTHKPLLAAAARGKMSEATWQRIADEAVKLASEES